MKHLLPLLFLFAACDKGNSNTNPPPAPPKERFTGTPENYLLSRPLAEASGIADSRTINEHLWVIEDGGNPARLFLLKHDGFITDSLSLEGATNRDWEDIAIGKGPVESQSYLYVGDIGDNNAVYSSYTIYRMPEPANFGSNITVYDKIEFVYPDGSHDAEAFLIDDDTRDIYVITKRENASKVYKIPYPQDTGAINQAVFVDDLPFKDVVSGTLSVNGTELILKTYTNLYYYSRAAKEGLAVTLSRNPTDTLSYQLEPQGEAVAFANNNLGFFTLSEKGMIVANADLMFYRRN
jgi:hypothetical protein